MRRREFITVVGSAVASSPVATWAQQPDDRARALHGRILRLQAEYAADKIDQFVEGIKSQIGWTTQLLWSAAILEQRRFDALRLLKQVPAIKNVTQLDSTGLKRLQTTLLGIDPEPERTDYSRDPKFTEAMAKGVYYGPVYVGRTSEPYMTLSLAGTRRDFGVTVAEVNLKPIQDWVTRTKVGDHGVAYVLDYEGRVIAHSNVSRFFQQDFSGLAHVQAAHTVGSVWVAGSVEVVRDINGREVLATYSRVTSLGWPVFVELPVEEANFAAQ